VDRTAVIALGGNALTREGQAGRYDEQYANAREMARAVAALLTEGWRAVVVHGNGPQVGNLAMQAERAATLVPAQPLFALDAMTQGQLGSMIALALLEQCRDLVAGVVSLVTHVVVRPDDPAFAHPTKPIGPFFDAERAERLTSEGVAMVEDAGRGYRHVVASPLPVAVLEADAVGVLVDQGYLVVACGGGGVPVTPAPEGPGYRGVEAVIDKDHAAQRLATTIGAEALVLVTGVPCVQLDFGTPQARSAPTLTVDEAKRHLADGQFPAGSMGPKVAASVQFLEEGGALAVITTPELVQATLAGPGGGTRIIPGEAA
jgi:carbamate kinase